MKNNILEHKLVPEHVILSEKETNEVLEELNITKNQIPKILPTDPVVKAISAKPDDVLKITRDSATAGTFVSYRVVRE